MVLSISPNVRIAIHRATHPPPAAATATNVSGYLDGAYAEGLVRAQTRPSLRYTHVLLLDPAVDVRDDFAEFDRTGGRDLVVLGTTLFEVVFVERPFPGSAGDVKRVYLLRRATAWPNSNI